MLFRIAFRNLVRQWRRYIFIWTMTALGMGVILTLLGSIGGMTKIVEDKASRYFAGTLSVTAHSKSDGQLIRHGEQLEEVLPPLLDGRASYDRRTVYYNSDPQVFFSGESIVLRRLVGLDPSAAGGNYRSLVFASGGLEGAFTPGTCLLSESVALRLGAVIGDEILVQIQNRDGFQNTFPAKITGIFKETSIFSFVAYMNREDLNRAIGFPTGSATDWGINPLAHDRTLLEFIVRQSIAARYPLLATPSSKDERHRAIEGLQVDDSYEVLPLSFHLGQLQDVLDALGYLAWFLLVVLLAVVFIGLLNTFRMIVRERVREIGTMRALGMQRSSLTGVFLAEALILSVLGIIGGFVTGLILLQVVGLLDFSWYSAASLFLEDGHIRWNLMPAQVSGTVVVIVVSVIAGAWGPSRHAAKLDPVDALRSD